MGFVGREEGVAAYASVLLSSHLIISTTLFFKLNCIIIFVVMSSDVVIKIINTSENPVCLNMQLQWFSRNGHSRVATLQNPDVTLHPMERAMIPTGIFIRNYRHGYEAQMRPRSGLALKQGITCLNSPGTIDSDYQRRIKSHPYKFIAQKNKLFITVSV